MENIFAGSLEKTVSEQAVSSGKMVLTRRQAAIQTEHDEDRTVPPRSSSPNRKKIHNGSAKHDKQRIKQEFTPFWVIALLLVFVAVTIVTIPHPFQPHGEPTMNHVFYYGWLTALSTGLGVLPFICLPDVPTFWVGISNGEWFLYMS